MGDDLNVGAMRGVALMGGRGARLSLRRSFPGVVIDAPGLDMAHAADGAARAAALGANTALLTFSWGLPPELDEVDRLGFGRVVRLYHDAGLRVIAGVMASSYALQASYAARDWFARDSFDRRIRSAVGRVYACWNHPDWLETVQAHALQALDAGADGVWLIDPWPGGVPHLVNGGLLGAAGCSCPRCQAAYSEASGGAAIPAVIALQSQDSQHYLEWRENLTTQRIGEWATAAREQSPGAMVVVEGAPSQDGLAALRYGHDPAALAQHIDLYLVRNPLHAGQDAARPAAALASARVRLGEQARPAALLGPKRAAASHAPEAVRLAQAHSAAVALGSAPVVDGTPYTSDNGLTLLIASPFGDLRETIGACNGWLAAQHGWLQERTSAGSLAIYCPPALTWWKNGPVDPLADAACAAVIRLGMPLRVVGDEPWDGVTTLIVPPGQIAGLDARLAQFSEAGGRVIALQQMRTGSVGRPLWTNYEPVRPGWRHARLVRRASARHVLLGARWHRGGAVHRRLARWLRLPGSLDAEAASASLPDALVDELAAALAGDVCPRVQAAEPVLLTLWREPQGGTQWHLVNLAQSPQRVTIVTGGFLSGWVVAPEQDEPKQVFGSDIVVSLDRYKVLRIPPEQDEA